MKLGEAIRIEKPDMPVLANYVEDCFGRDIELSECGRPQMSQLKKFILSKVCQNSAKMYLASIKAVLNIYKDEGELRCSDFSLLSVKSEATVSTYLSTSELRMLEKYLGRATPAERYYMMYFLCSAYTGCRVSDVRTIRKSGIRNGMLAYVSEKTGIKAEVPAKRGLRTWLELIETEEMQRGKDFSRRVYNGTIKTACKKAGIDDVVSVYRAGKAEEGPKWQFVSTHTARRSFATNLYLAGCDLYTISRMMGHSSPDMTKGYICCGLRDLSPEVMEYFK